MTQDEDLKRAIENCTDFGPPEQMDLENISTAAVSDLLRLALAYLPTQDPRPVTDEWVRTLPGAIPGDWPELTSWIIKDEDGDPLRELQYNGHSRAGKPWTYFDENGDSCYLPTPANRGVALQLVLAMGFGTTT